MGPAGIIPPHPIIPPHHINPPHTLTPPAGDGGQARVLEQREQDSAGGYNCNVMGMNVMRDESACACLRRGGATLVGHEHANKKSNANAPLQYKNT